MSDEELKLIEPQPEEPKPKKPGYGRHKNPVYADMDPVRELYVKVRNHTRKTTKRIPLGHFEMLREERILLSVMYPQYNLNPSEEELEEMFGKKPKKPLAPPTAPAAEVEKPWKLDLE